MGFVKTWWRTPRVRKRVAGMIAIVALVLAAVGFFTARYGLIFVAVIVALLAAASGPARLRK
ncbi:MAG TPA: hypothetical protein VFU07_06805 [Candidatus Lumbricidophila sp.]|nr:hypothetical protein [Candidatus Lumbricidophila sp.]